MKKHLTYLVYVGHVAYNTSFALFLFLVSVPYNAKTKEEIENHARQKVVFIFDMGGVLAKTNKAIAAKHIGYSLLATRLFWYLQPFSNLQPSFYTMLDRIFLDTHGEQSIQIAYDPEGRVLPFFMRLWLSGKIKSNEIRDCAVRWIQNNQSYFENDTEQEIMNNLVHFVFNPHTLIQTQYMSEDAIQLVRKLKLAGYRLFILSNWDAESFSLLEEKYADFFSLFDSCIVSGREGYIKPDPALYDVFLAKCDVRPEQCIFIDDQIENIESAISKNILGILCHDFRSVAHIISNYFLA